MDASDTLANVLETGEPGQAGQLATATEATFDDSSESSDRVSPHVARMHAVLVAVDALLAGGMTHEAHALVRSVLVSPGDGHETLVRRGT